MKENFSLEEIDARFYSALAEFERLVSRGVLSVSTQLLFCSYKN